MAAGVEDPAAGGVTEDDGIYGRFRLPGLDPALAAGGSAEFLEAPVPFRGWPRKGAGDVVAADAFGGIEHEDPFSGKEVRCKCPLPGR
jgi:hypothetical protein